ncbi:unnamed protein product [Ambrosiozyma monospora]|uniref:Unnamed protein product n=1 Tax=Ambrosiozyma monospora TaxID=43982 RepID=A0ACB5SQW4_AMBMO|nr:unnamed protein product [Ambrosiozyma monospora]
MALEISISIEETNMLRLQVGLPPIPIEKDRHEATSRKDTSGKKNGNYQTLLKGTGRKVNSSSLSIEETNKLRAQVGLLLIPLEDGRDDKQAKEINEYNNYENLQSSKHKNDKINDLKQRLDDTKDSLKKKKLMESGTLLDRIEDQKTDDDWLKSLGKTTHKKKEKKKRSTLKKKEDVPADNDDLEGLNIKHDKGNFEELLGNGNDVVLTLKDKGVLDEGDSEDELENLKLKEEFKIQETLKERFKQKKVDTESEFRNSGFDMAGDGKIREGSFGLKEVQNRKASEPKSEGQENKKRKLVVFENDDDSDDEPASDYERVSKKKFKKLKKTMSQRVKRDSEITKKELKKVELINEDLENEDNADLSSFIDATRRKKQKTRKPVEISPHEDEETESENFETKNSGIVISEELDFISAIKADDHDDSKASQVLINKKHDISEKEIKNKSPETEHPSNLTGFLYDDPASKMTTSLGLSDTLKLLKSKEKPADKSSTDKKLIKITYRDDEGNVLDTKSAFKYQSHKFHGFKKRK